MSGTLHTSYGVEECLREKVTVSTRKKEKKKKEIKIRAKEKTYNKGNEKKLGNKKEGE